MSPRHFYVAHAARSIVARSHGGIHASDTSRFVLSCRYVRTNRFAFGPRQAERET